jgi:cytochrome c-type biogenesis protein
MLLIAAGGAMVAGWTFVGTGQGLADRLGGVATRRGIAGYFAYGIAYALASLGCTLPIFLTVLASAVLAGGWVGELLQFVLFGIGMSLVLTALTLLAAIFKTQLLLRLRVLGRIVDPLSAVLLLAVGGYILYYWLTLGGLLHGAA